MRIIFLMFIDHSDLFVRDPDDSPRGFDRNPNPDPLVPAVIVAGLRGWAMTTCLRCLQAMMQVVSWQGPTAVMLELARHARHSVPYGVSTSAGPRHGPHVNTEASSNN